jgi:hypothetical protein
MSFWRVLVIGGKATPFAVGKAVLGTNIVLPPGDGKSWLMTRSVTPWTVFKPPWIKSQNGRG